MDKYKFKIFMSLILSGLLTGGLQVCFNMPLLAFVSLMPLVMAVRDFSSKKDYFLKITAFLVPYYFIQSAFLITVYKLINLPIVIGFIISALLTAAVTLWLTMLMMLPLSVYPFVKKGGKLDLLLFSFLFVLGEYVSEYVPILSFPWSGLWLSLAFEPMLTQPAALLGCRFVSFLILVGNCFVSLAFLSKKLSSVLKNSALFLLIIIFFLTYSTSHISNLKINIKDSESIRVMAAQDCVEGKEKNKLTSSDAVDRYISIMEENWQDNVKLVVLPETAIPAGYDKNSKEFQKLCEFVKSKNTTVFAGCFLNKEQNRYNAMYSVTSDGFCKTPYLKQILVPFGEKIPFASVFEKNSITAGEKDNAFCLTTSENIKAANIICIESIYPSITRSQLKKEGEILCISTNDSWFGKSYARYAHYRHSLMRAVESGKYTIRAGNCGVSAIITPWGEAVVLQESPVKAVITADVKLNKSTNLYIKLGDVMAVPGLITAVIGSLKALKKLIFKLKKPC